VRVGLSTVEQFVDSATATDASTSRRSSSRRRTRAGSISCRTSTDIGIYPVPKHVYDKQDWTSFKAFDLAKDWPPTTGPWKLVAGFA
jgi:hypothetical protein